MTMTATPRYAGHAARTSRPASVPPAVVWDLPSAISDAPAAASVRSLGDSNRTSGRSNADPNIAEWVDVAPVDARGESRANVLMGALLGFALILGSAFGGVFTGSGAVSGAGGDVTREVVTAELR